MRSAAAHFVQRSQRSLDSRKIHVFGVDLRLHSADKLPRQRSVTRGMTHFDQRLLFPVVRRRSVVAQRMREAGGQLAFAALRPQAHVDAEHRALACRSGKNIRHFL